MPRVGRSRAECSSRHGESRSRDAELCPRGRIQPRFEACFATFARFSRFARFARASRGNRFADTMDRSRKALSARAAVIAVLLALLRPGEYSPDSRPPAPRAIVPLRRRDRIPFFRVESPRRSFRTREGPPDCYNAPRRYAAVAVTQAQRVLLTNLFSHRAARRAPWRGQEASFRSPMVLTRGPNSRGYHTIVANR